MFKAVVAWAHSRWMKRTTREGRRAERVLARARGMPVVPTRFGMALLAVLLVMFVWSINYRLNLGYFLTFLLTIVAMLSAGVTVFQLAGLKVRVRGGEAVFLGEMARFEVVVSEQEGRTRGTFVVAHTWGQEQVSGVLANNAQTIVVEQPTHARGWQEVGDLRLSTTLPFGMFICWQWLWLEGRVLVYPRPDGALPLPSLSPIGEGVRTAAVAGEEDFSGLRAYVAGDALSKVAWKLVGRGELLLKQFEGQAEEGLTLDYAKIQGDVEGRLSQLTRWVLQAQALGLAYALYLPNKVIAQGSGVAHQRACLQALALFEA